MTTHRLRDGAGGKGGAEKESSAPDNIGTQPLLPRPYRLADLSQHLIKPPTPFIPFLPPQSNIQTSKRGKYCSLCTVVPITIQYNCSLPGPGHTSSNTSSIETSQPIANTQNTQNNYSPCTAGPTQNTTPNKCTIVATTTKSSLPGHDNNTSSHYQRNNTSNNSSYSTTNSEPKPHEHCALACWHQLPTLQYRHRGYRDTTTPVPLNTNTTLKARSYFPQETLG